MKTLIKPIWWRSLLLLLGLLYLVPEAIFNAQLVSLVGLGTPSSDDLEHLELYGRAVSGIGVALLLADFLPKAWVAKVGRAAISFIALLCLVWPVVFYGQKYVIENTLIGPSTAQQRQFAVYSAALRDALAINAIKINDLDYDPKQLHSSENLTFLALFGGLLYSDTGLSDNLEQNKRQIITRFVQKKAYQDFDNYYQQYSELYDELVIQYKEYVKGSKKYNHTLGSISAREQGYWQQVEQQVNEGWGKYQNAQKAHIAKASARAQKYGPKIYDYHKTVAKCQERYKKNKYKKSRIKCIERATSNYRSNILKAGVGYIEPDYWLIVEDISATENAANSILMGVLTGGVYTALQAASLAAGGDGGIKDKRYKYTSDPDHYQLRFLQHPKFHRMFEKETGYKFTINDLITFRGNEQTSKKLRRHFANKGLSLNANWNISQRAQFAAAVKNKVINEANKQWRKALGQKGLNLKPNLSWVQFQLHPDIQNKIKQRMGDLYVPNLRADWNKKNFKKKVVDPNIKKRADKYIAMLYSSEAKYMDGGEYEVYAKQALRSVIIPPISMSISLFLICLTFSKLPLKFLALFSSIRRRAPVADVEQKKPAFSIMSLLLKLAMPVIILVVPVLFIHNTFTNDEKSPVNYLLNKIDESSNPIFSYAVRWTLHTQPILHPLGLTLENTFKIYENFHPLSKTLAKIDIVKHVNTQLTPAQRRHQNYVLKQQTKLTINTNVRNANISIMNIGPKYRAGMLLKAASYDIKVTAPGYKTYRRWHQLEAGEQTLSLNLVSK